jgi:putative endonuclease
MKTTYQTGLTGEKTAAEWLQGKYRMQLIETRYRNKAGEIDLIMLDQNTIVFIEVKTRLHATAGSGLMAVDRRKQKRIARAATLYLISKGMQNQAVRFDVVEVSCSGVLHIPNAFQPGGMFYR